MPDGAAMSRATPSLALDLGAVSVKGGARSDAALVRAAQAGGTEAIEALFDRHWPVLHQAAYLVVHDAAAAEDIAQEAFLAGLRALDRFDRRRPLRPWLHRIAVNRAIDHARARALRREADGPSPETESTAPEPMCGLGEDVMAALALLDPEQRAVVVLRHLLGYSPGEIASLIDVPRGTVNSRLRRGLDSLAQTLGDRR
ncbi:MAG: polymerase, sigma-24 subunit, subfamily [Solirubrobacterales bacterium]|nr:polymerase, sigma-24 subunit, subfamily [Solirubrobacterales bacterium]